MTDLHRVGKVTHTATESPKEVILWERFITSWASKSGKIARPSTQTPQLLVNQNREKFSIPSETAIFEFTRLVPNDSKITLPLSPIDTWKRIVANFRKKIQLFQAMSNLLHFCDTRRTVWKLWSTRAAAFSVRTEVNVTEMTCCKT